MDDDSQTCFEDSQVTKISAVSLDCLKCHVKLFIDDIHSFYLQYGYVMHKEIPIKKVDIQGVIVEIQEFSERTRYKVDDGTGIITCFQNKRKNNSRSAVFSHQEAKLKSLELVFEADIRGGIHEFLKNLEEKKRLSISPFSLGDVIHVLGSLKTWSRQLYIDIYHLYNVTDPNAEVLRNLELLTLYYHVYK